MSPTTEPLDAALEVRQARADEQALIRRLVTRARLDPSNLHWQNFLLAEVNGEVVGCVQIRPYPGLRELGSMVVRSSYRKRGVGGALMRAILGQSVPPIFLECPAYRVSFYERFGFHVVGVREIPWVLRVKWILGNTLVRWLTGIPIRAMRWDGPSAMG